MLLGEQILRTLSGPSTFKSVTLTAFNGMLKKFDQRLSGNMVAAYSHGYISQGPTATGEDQHDGMRFLKQLRDAKAKFDGVAPYVEALLDTSTSGMTLIQLSNDAKKFVNLPAEAFELGLQRCLNSMSADDRWQEWAASVHLSLLGDPVRLARHASCESMGSQVEASLSPDLDLIDEAMQEDFQQRALVNTIVDFLREDNAVHRIVSLFAVLDVKRLKNQEVATEMKDFGTLLDPWSAKSSEELGKLRTQYATNTGLKLHKGLTLFPTGVLIMDAVEVCRLQWLEDDQCLKELGKIKVPAPVDSASYGDLETIELPDNRAWKKCAVDFQRVCEKASDKFKRSHSAKVTTVQDAIKIAGDAVVGAIRAGVQAKLGVITEAFKNMAADPEDENVYSEIAAACDEAIRSVPSSKSCLLEALGAELAKSLDKEMQESKADMLLLQDAGGISQSRVSFEGQGERVVELAGLVSNQVGSFNSDIAAAVKGWMAAFLRLHINDQCARFEEVITRMQRQGGCFASGPNADETSDTALVHRACLVEGLLEVLP